MKAFLSKTEWFSFPVTVQELNWMEFNDIRATEQAFLQSVQLPEVETDGDSAADPTPELSHLEQLERALEDSEASANHIIDLLAIVLDGDWDQIPFSVPGDNVQELMVAGFRYNLDTALTEELSLMRLYVHLVNIINGYEEKAVDPDFSLDWKGQTYYIDPLEAYKALSGMDFTAGEAITVLEFQKKTLEKIAAKGDRDCNLSFNLGAREIAVLLRKKGEKLPFKSRERISFINARVKIFQDLPLDIVLNIRFFFLNILEKYELIQDINFSSTGWRTKQLRTRIRKGMRLRLKSGKLLGK